MASPIVSFRCPQELKEQIEATAQANDMTASEWLMGLVRRELESPAIAPTGETVNTLLDSVNSDELDERIESAIVSRLDSFHRNMEYTLEQYADRMEALEKKLRA